MIRSTWSSRSPKFPDCAWPSSAKMRTHEVLLPQQTFYIGLILDSISARHRLPISAQCRMCNSATHRADIGNWYCADIHRSSLFLAKTRFSWLLKPSANKIGKSLQRGWLLWKAAYIILTWGCYAAFEDIGTSSSDDKYSRARKHGFLLHFFRSPTKMWTKLSKVSHIFLTCLW